MKTATTKKLTTYKEHADVVATVSEVVGQSEISELFKRPKLGVFMTTLKGIKLDNGATKIVTVMSNSTGHHASVEIQTGNTKVYHEYTLKNEAWELTK